MGHLHTDIILQVYSYRISISFQSSSISSIILHEFGRRVYLGAAVSHFLVCKHKSICSYCIYSSVSHWRREDWHVLSVQRRRLQYLDFDYKVQRAVVVWLRR